MRSRIDMNPKGGVMKPVIYMSVILAAILSLPEKGPCETHSKPIIETITNGQIDWTNWLIRAKGRGTPSEKINEKHLASSMALKTAQIDAHDNLFKAIQEIRIEPHTKVKNLIAVDERIKKQVQVMSREAQLVKKEYMSDSQTVEVTIEMRLTNGFAQLILPQDIKQIEPIKATLQETEKQENTNSSTDDEPHSYTGLVVDARGLDILPAMTLRLIDENGAEIYGSAYSSREYAVQQGMIKYEKNLKSAVQDHRVADNPLIIKGLKASPTGFSDIIISNTDASKLLSASENLSFLRECRVVIVCDKTTDTLSYQSKAQ